MTAAREPSAAAPAAPPTAPAGARRWFADLAMGVRFAVNSGREGWIRTVLTGLGVALGVVVLLLAASIPHMMGARDARIEAREGASVEGGAPRSDRSALYLSSDTEYHGKTVRGWIMQADGSRPPVPPGVATFPGPGEMVVSPELKELLASAEGTLLRKRLPGRITGTIADEGLAGPTELAFVAGTDDMPKSESAYRVDRFGEATEPLPMGPTLTLLITVACVVLLMPVAAFVAVAARFGGERRDRRLAALRLVGADTWMTHRVAAGEAATGAVLGLLLGSALFAVLRGMADRLPLGTSTPFVADVTPSPALSALIILGVPAGAVLVSLFALRTVAVDPLGVVRRAGSRPRRLVWRLVPLVLGLGLLAPSFAKDSSATSDMAVMRVAAGLILFLIGSALLLPWLIEALVRRLSGGGLSFQLAVRRLQLDSGSASRAITGVTLAVAGAVALQLLIGAVQQEDAEGTRRKPPRADLSVETPAPGALPRLHRELAKTPGVTDTWVVFSSYVHVIDKGPRSAEATFAEVMVADCPTLRQLVKLDRCADGDVFTTPIEESKGGTVSPGAVLDLNGEDEGAPVRWQVPRHARAVPQVSGFDGTPVEGILATPKALAVHRLGDEYSHIYLRTDSAEPEAAEHVRNTASAFDPLTWVSPLAREPNTGAYRATERAVYFGAAVLLLIIGAGMVVTTVEQLRERRRLLSVLVAFGTRRTTLLWSVLWQTALPMAVGLAMATVTGLGLGTVLLRIGGVTAEVDWANLAAMVGLGAALVALVTLVSLPLLWRLMRPEGLRTE